MVVYVCPARSKRLTGGHYSLRNVYNNRGNYSSFEGKLGSQKKEYEGNLSESQKYTDAYSALMGLKGEMNEYIVNNKLKGFMELNDFGLTDKQNEYFNGKINDLVQKYGKYLMGGAGGATGEIYQGLFDPNNPLLGNILAAAQKYNVGATQGEYGNLYGNELEMVKRNLEHRYGGTYDELSGKFFSGSDKDRNAFMQMVQGIQGLSSMFPGLDPGYMFGSDKILESLKPLVTGDVVQAYAGKSKVNGTDPMSLLNNYIVDLSSQGKAGIFEADKTSVSDISSKIGAGSATKDEIKSMQDTLQRYGYDLGKSGVDGNLGPKTKAALKQFQDDVSSGKLTLDTLPDSITKATTSIDGLTTAANAFVSWINRNIIGNPGTTGPTGTTTGVTGQDAGSGAGPGSGAGEGCYRHDLFGWRCDELSSFGFRGKGGKCCCIFRLAQHECKQCSVECQYIRAKAREPQVPNGRWRRAGYARSSEGERRHHQWPGTHAHRRGWPGSDHSPERKT